jgi:hypothetical protein
MWDSNKLGDTKYLEAQISVTQRLPSDTVSLQHSSVLTPETEGSIERSGWVLRLQAGWEGRGGRASSVREVEEGGSLLSCHLCLAHSLMLLTVAKTVSIGGRHSFSLRLRDEAVRALSPAAHVCPL